MPFSSATLESAAICMPYLPGSSRSLALVLVQLRSRLASQLNRRAEILCLAALLQASGVLALKLSPGMFGFPC